MTLHTLMETSIGKSNYLLVSTLCRALISNAADGHIQPEHHILTKVCVNAEGSVACWLMHNSGVACTAPHRHIKVRNPQRVFSYTALTSAFLTLCRCPGFVWPPAAATARPALYSLTGPARVTQAMRAHAAGLARTTTCLARRQ